MDMSEESYIETTHEHEIIEKLLAKRLQNGKVEYLIKVNLFLLNKFYQKLKKNILVF